MPLTKTEAVILKQFNWSESSRTVVFFTNTRGKLALIDKGGRSFKSKRGRLLRLARMEITYYRSERQSSGYISEVELLQVFSMEGDGSLGRLTFASAACETLFKLLPDEEEQTQLYSYFLAYLKTLETVRKDSLPSLFISFFVRVISSQGYHPSLGFCVGCGKESDKISAENTNWIDFSAERGGLVCRTCQRATDDYIRFSKESYNLLKKLETASLSEAANMPMGYQESVQLIDGLSRFVSFQTGLKPELKSLEFLEKLKNTDLLQ